MNPRLQQAAGPEGQPRARRLGVALIGKGSVNTLHAQDLIDQFAEQGVRVSFIVREDYATLVAPLERCGYLTCRFPPEEGRERFWRDLCRYLRALYPVGGMGRRKTDGVAPWRRRVTHGLLRVLARFKTPMRLVSLGEHWLYRREDVEGLDPGDLDQLLLLNVGGHGSEFEARLAWWARRHGVPVTHLAGNYDTFTSKGYPGVPVDRVLVWGQTMVEDAIRLHDLRERQVRPVGSLRHDRMHRTVRFDRAAFLEKCGLDAGKKVILFAGPLGEYHYFEMLQVLEEMRQEGREHQLILRLYPDKNLMRSCYAKPLIEYAQAMGGVYASIGDPHYRVGFRDQEVPNIEQEELWHSVRYADVVVNVFSTITLEACLFDRPVVYMGYFPMKGYAWLRPPRYADYERLSHNRRLLEYGAVRKARDRKELIAMIEEAMAHPERGRAARRLAVERELGLVDGQVCRRVVQAVCEAFRGPGAVTGIGRMGKGWGDGSARIAIGQASGESESSRATGARR